MRGITLFFLAFPLLVFAATADQWRSRSIYQLIVDRYALPQGADLNACDPGAQTWCGGTWNTYVLLSLSLPLFHPYLLYFSVTQNLDYIQDLGFIASVSLSIILK